MKRIYELSKGELIAKTAVELKKIDTITPPIWSDYVKTGVQKARPPVQRDWWYIRAASVLVSTLELGPVGVSKLRTKYGGKKRRGHKPPEFRKASGNILRKILQQLEKAEFVVQKVVSGHKGRVVTPKGISFLENIAKTGVKPKKRPVKEVVEKEDMTKKDVAKEAKPAKKEKAEEEAPAEKPQKKASDNKKPEAKQKANKISKKAAKEVTEKKPGEVVEETTIKKAEKAD